MHSPNFMDANIEKLAELFPGCVTESADDKGNLKKSIDFDQLRQELSDSIVDGPQERYQLNWPGKRELFLPPMLPLPKPCVPVGKRVLILIAQRIFLLKGIIWML